MALIYIVEDDEPIRRELAEVLERAGFAVKASEEFSRVTEDILDAAPDLTDSISVTRYDVRPRSPSSSSRRARPKSTRS